METIRRAATRDHHQIMALLDATLGALDVGDLAQARESLTTFARRLRTHHRIVEELLAPAVQRLVPDDAVGAMVASGREHAVFLEILAEIEGGLARGARGQVIGNLRELRAGLLLHFAREEQALYPMVDRAVQSATVVALADLLTEHFTEHFTEHQLT